MNTKIKSAKYLLLMEKEEEMYINIIVELALRFKLYPRKMTIKFDSAK